MTDLAGTPAAAPDFSALPEVGGDVYTAPLKRPGHVGEDWLWFSRLRIVGPTLFLASAASGAMTGQAMVVDGGVVVTG